MKEIRFVNNPSLKEFKALPDKIKKRFANDLNALSQGKEVFSKTKSLGDTVGSGAIELIQNGKPAYRSVYVAKFGRAIYVLHSFVKTTNGVDRKAMATAKRRYSAMKDELKQ